MSLNELVGEWYYDYSLGYKGKLPSQNFGLFYMKCLLDIVAADGIVSEEERNWVVGYAAISGYSDEVIEQAKKYDPINDKGDVQVLQADKHKEYVELNRLSLIYNAFRAAGADGHIPQEEYEAISIFAKKIGANDKQLEQVRLLYEDELKLRKKRTELLLPGGVNLGELLAELNSNPKLDS